MVSVHEQARREFDTLASEIATRIVNVAFPKLMQQHGKAAKQKREEVKLPGSVSRQLYDKAGSDLELIDAICLLVHEKAESTLKTRLGRSCKSVDIHPGGGLKRGGAYEVSVLASFS